jgi:hypothetical protein
MDNIAKYKDNKVGVAQTPETGQSEETITETQDQSESADIS